VASKRKPPAEVVAFDVNENTVAVARLSLLATVDRIASWNRQYINPAVYSIRTDFGRLAKRYEAVRNAKLEELKRKYPLRAETRRRGGKTLQTLESSGGLRGGLGRGGVRRAG
jgi:putative transposase